MLGLLAMLGCKPEADSGVDPHLTKSPASYRWQDQKPQIAKRPEPEIPCLEISDTPFSPRIDFLADCPKITLGSSQPSTLPQNHSVQPVDFQVAQNDAPNIEPEIVPGPKQLVRVPIDPAPSGDGIQLTSTHDRISLTARDAPLGVVLALIAEQHGLNVVTKADVSEHITVKLSDTPLDDALDVLLSVNDYTWTRQKNIIIV